MESFLFENSSIFNEYHILYVIKYLITLKTVSINVTLIDNQLFLNTGKNFTTYFLSYLTNNEVDKNFFFSIMKKNNELQITPDELLILLNSLIDLFKLNTVNNINSFKNYFSIFSDLLMMFNLQDKIENDIFFSLHSEVEKVKREIQENHEILILKNLKENNIKLKYVKNLGEHLQIEYLKI